MPEEIEIDAKHTVKGYLQVDQWCAKGGLRPAPINGNTRAKYIRADLIGLQCFYNYEGNLPKQFVAIYDDGSGANLFWERVKGKYQSEGIDQFEDCVDKDWFTDAGYLWFIALPDDFKVWGEQDAAS